MKNFVLEKFILTIIFCSVVLAAITTNSFAQDEEKVKIGISPGKLTNERLLKESTFEREFTIVRGEVNEDATVVIKLDDSLVSEWISFSPSKEFTINEGEDKKTFKAIISVPEDAKLDVYESSFTVHIYPPRSDGQVAIVPGAEIGINLKVSDTKVSDWEVRYFNINDFYQNEDLILNLKINNKGNVEDGPSKVVLDIKNTNGEVVSTLEKNEIEKISPFTLSGLDVSFRDHHLEAGEYFAQVKIFDENELKSEERVNFNVFYTQSTFEKFKSSWIGKFLFKGGWILLALSAFFLIILFFKRDRKEEKEN